jgi:hypothetical protein
MKSCRADLDSKKANRCEVSEAKIRRGGEAYEIIFRPFERYITAIKSFDEEKSFGEGKSFPRDEIKPDSLRLDGGESLA